MNTTRSPVRDTKTDPVPDAITPENVPQEWVEAANAHYSMHGAGLIRNIIAGVAPLIRADAEKALRDIIAARDRELDQLRARIATLESA